jgi:hypothetical protein
MDVKTAIENGNAEALRDLLREEPSRANENRLVSFPTLG